MTIGVVLFPGTNCEADVVEAVRSLGGEAEIVWHGDRRLGSAIDAVVLPGGFAHGDYLRTGAIARFSPVMDAVAAFASDGGPVVGICNGFQVLCEAGLLPGALRKNAGLKFLCQPASIRVETDRSVLTSEASIGQVLTIPINHFEGSYTCEPRTLDELKAEDSGGVSLRREPEWRTRRHRRSLQRRTQRRRPDATSRAGQSRPLGLDRWNRAAALAAGRRQGQREERLTPAFFSTTGSTPTSRHAAYEMPFRWL